MADKTIVCKDCGSEFIFTEGEQAFYQEKGFTNDPVRCPEIQSLIIYIIVILYNFNIISKREFDFISNSLFFV